MSTATGCGSMMYLTSLIQRSWPAKTKWRRPRLLTTIGVATAIPMAVTLVTATAIRMVVTALAGVTLQLVITVTQMAVLVPALLLVNLLVLVARMTVVRMVSSRRITSHLVARLHLHRRCKGHEQSP